MAAQRPPRSSFGKLPVSIPDGQKMLVPYAVQLPGIADTIASRVMVNGPLCGVSSVSSAPPTSPPGPLHMTRTSTGVPGAMPAGSASVAVTPARPPSVEQPGQVTRGGALWKKAGPGVPPHTGLESVTDALSPFPTRSSRWAKPTVLPGGTVSG